VYVALPEIQEKLGGPGGRTKISLQTGQRWLKKLDWRYGRKKNGMYIDGHEREDIVKYRGEFIERWKEYEKRMVTYNNDGNIMTTPQGFTVPQGARFRLILVTHDESTFYQEDRRKMKWTHKDDKPIPERKGKGSSIMISDFLTPEWGRLKDDDDEARIVWLAGKIATAGLQPMISSSKLNMLSTSLNQKLTALQPASFFLITHPATKNVPPTHYLPAR